jgi:hypothetical protein
MQQESSAAPAFIAWIVHAPEVEESDPLNLPDP